MGVNGFDNQIACQPFSTTAVDDLWSLTDVSGINLGLAFLLFLEELVNFRVFDVNDSNLKLYRTSLRERWHIIVCLLGV